MKQKKIHFDQVLKKRQTSTHCHKKTKHYITIDTHKRHRITLCQKSVLGPAHSNPFLSTFLPSFEWIIHLNKTVKTIVIKYNLHCQRSTEGGHRLTRFFEKFTDFNRKILLTLFASERMRLVPKYLPKQIYTQEIGMNLKTISCYLK